MNRCLEEWDSDGQYFQCQLEVGHEGECRCTNENGWKSTHIVYAKTVECEPMQVFREAVEENQRLRFVPNHSE